MWFLLAKFYGQIVFFIHEIFKVNMPGLGYICRRIKRDRIIDVRGRKYYFYPAAASMYSLLVARRFPEPETHLFFGKVIPGISEKIGFIDVGAAVGEMIIDVASYYNVDHVIGFEPDPDLVEACRLSAEINDYSKVRIIPKAVADEVGIVNFMFNSKRGVSGRISEGKSCSTTEILSTTLDSEVPKSDLPYIVLIDTEGAEPLVLKGGVKFVRHKYPLIVFEYCGGDRYTLSEIVDIVGEGYQIYRLNSSGCLDNELNKAWNCVAVHKSSVFYPVCQSIISK